MLHPTGNRETQEICCFRENVLLAGKAQVFIVQHLGCDWHSGTAPNARGSERWCARLGEGVSLQHISQFL